MLVCLFFGLLQLIYLPSIIYNSSFNPPDTPDTLKGSAYGAQRSDLSFGLTGLTDFAVCVFLIIFAIVSKKVGLTFIQHHNLHEGTTTSVCVRARAYKGTGGLICLDGMELPCD